MLINQALQLIDEEILCPQISLLAIFQTISLVIDLLLPLSRAKRDKSEGAKRPSATEEAA